jgi:hypothetical protein
MIDWLKALQKEAEKAAPALPAAPARQGPPAEIHPVTCQLRPSDPMTGSPGEVLIGGFMFEYSHITLATEAGTPLGRGMDCPPTMILSRSRMLLRKQPSDHNGFERALPRQPVAV